MPSLFDIYYEASSDGTDATRTDNAQLSFLALRGWTECTVTYRRRAPHTFTVTIPRSTGHLLTDFTPGREMRIKRNDAHWFGGFLNAPSLPGGRAGEVITLPGWGSARALMFYRNALQSAGLPAIFGPVTDANAIILSMVANSADGGGTRWYPAGGTTIGTATYATANDVYFAGKDAVEVINEWCAVEGWEWRTGMASDGTFTFNAGSTVAVDHSASVVLVDGANCLIDDYRSDASNLATLVGVAVRQPAYRTNLNGALSGGATTVTVDTTANMETGDDVVIGEGTTLAEVRTITVISGTQFTVSALTNAHADNEIVISQQQQSYRTSTVDDATASKRHHAHVYYVFNDQLRDVTARTRYATAVLAAYNHPIQSASVSIVDPAMIELWLTKAIEPGDTVGLLSDDPLLASAYPSGSTAVVQEMSLTLLDGVCRSINLRLGDQELDALATTERMMVAARNNSTAV